jgi:molybdenum cofactor cytidylyltransferase
MIDRFPIHAVLLAAGASTRFGSADKLLADIDGTPLVVRSAELLVSAGLDGVTAVVAQNAAGDDVATALGGLQIAITRNPDSARGMGSSIACGTAALSDLDAGIMIVPADMPMLNSGLLRDLIALYRTHQAAMIVHPVTPDGAQRNPVIWPPQLRSELLNLDGPAGGKRLLTANASRIVTHAASPHVFEDIDTQDDLSRFREGAT